MLSPIMATSPHATRCAPCGDVTIIGNWTAQGWGFFDKGAGGRVRWNWGLTEMATKNSEISLLD